MIELVSTKMMCPPAIVSPLVGAFISSTTSTLGDQSLIGGTQLFGGHLQSLEIRSAAPRLRGMSYICSQCSALLYHVGARKVTSTGMVFPLQPFQVAARVKQCPRCGHRLQQEARVDSIKVTAIKSKSKSLNEAVKDLLDSVNEGLDQV
jgi:DNA-directed RNA polymerase subunit RPC12/RpoP